MFLTKYHTHNNPKRQIILGYQFAPEEIDCERLDLTRDCTSPGLAPVCKLCLAAQSCQLFATPWNAPPPPVTFVHRDSPEQNTGVGRHAVHQEIAPTQGSNPGLPILGKFFTTWATKEAPAPDYQTPYPKFSLPILLYFPNFILRSQEQTP